jgi:hypothetical protein
VWKQNVSKKFLFYGTLDRQKCALHYTKSHYLLFIFAIISSKMSATFDNEIGHRSYLCGTKILIKLNYYIVSWFFLFFFIIN